MENYCLTLCYDGTRYAGWQRQGNTDNTIQKKVEAALSRLLDETVQIHGCGRTDAGVHARMQTASFRCAEMDPDRTLSRLREVLPEDIGALSLTRADSRFHARLSCVEKTYRYRVWTTDDPNVFERKYIYRLGRPLDETRMNDCARLLEGRHDFAAFSSGRTNKSTVRTLKRIAIARSGPEITLAFTGDGFLYHMVRILTGTLIEAGLCQREPRSVLSALEAGDRALAGFTAPACGLTLWEIRY